MSDNTIADVDQVTVDGATLSAPKGAITVQGVEGGQNSTIQAIAAYGSGAQGYTGSGGVTVNSLDTTMNVDVGDWATAKLLAPVVFVDGAVETSILAAAFGGAGAGTAALTGSVVDDNISGGMTVDVDADATITAQAVVISATNNQKLQAIAGGADGAGTVSAGASVANNVLTDFATAEVVGATITAVNVTVLSDEAGSIQALAAMGNGAGTVAADASVTTNDIYETATASVVSGSVITLGANGQLQVQAFNASAIKSAAGGASGAGTVGVNAAVAYNNISDNQGAPQGAFAQLDDATVKNGSALVNADDDDNVQTLAIGAAGAGTVALGGSVGIATVDAYAAASAQGDTIDIGGALQITAQDNASITAGTGSAEGAGTVAGGAAVSVNHIMNSLNATLSGGSISAQSVSVKADNEAQISSIAAAGSGAGTASVAAGVTINTIGGVVDAAITGAAQVFGDDGVTVEATDHSSIGSLAGGAAVAGTAGVGFAVAVNRIGDEPDESSGNIGLGRSGATVTGGIENMLGDPANDPTEAPPNAATTASIDGGSLVGGGAILVHAAFDGAVKSGAIGAGGAGTVGGAASVTDNLVGDLVRAVIAGADTNVITLDPRSTSTVQVEADNTAEIDSQAGSVAAAGTAAIGAAIAINKLDNAALAIVDAASVRDGDNAVRALANGGGEIDTISVAGSGAGSAAINAALSVNDLDNDIEARALDGATIVAGDLVVLSANDGGDISSTATGLGLSGGFSASGAVADNIMGDTVKATAVGVTLTAVNGEVDLSAEEFASITSQSVSGAGGALAGVAATVSVNKIDNVIGAVIDGGVTSGAEVGVTAADNSSIDFDADEVAGGAVGFAGGAAYNEIENTVDALIQDGAGVTATAGDVIVSASEAAQVLTIGIDAAGGEFAGIGGSVSVSIIANSIDAGVANSTVTAYGNVGVLADDVNQIEAAGGGIAGGIVGIAASVAVLTLESHVEAAVDGSTVSGLGHTPGLFAPIVDATTGQQTDTQVGGVVVAARDVEAPYDGNDTVMAVTIAGGWVGVPATVDDIHSADVTDAHIAASAIDSASQPGSGVFVHASQSTEIDGKIGTGAVGVAAIGAAVQVATIDNVTRAYISDTDEFDGRRRRSRAEAGALDRLRQFDQRLDDHLGGSLCHHRRRRRRTLRGSAEPSATPISIAARRPSSRIRCSTHAMAPPALRSMQRTMPPSTRPW